MKCPNCGYVPPRGRPKKVDAKKVIALRKKGMSLRQIAEKLGISHGSARNTLNEDGEK